MSARDELARTIRWNCRAISDTVARTAASAILAAGYRKPRTITTASERALLAPGTIAVDEQGNAWKRGTGSWVSTGGDGPALYDDADITLTVLFASEARA